MSLEKNLHIFFGKKKQFCILVFFFLYFSLFRVCGVLCCWWCLTSPPRDTLPSKLPLSPLPIPTCKKMMMMLRNQLSRTETSLCPWHRPAIGPQLSVSFIPPIQKKIPPTKLWMGIECGGTLFELHFLLFCTFCLFFSSFLLFYYSVFVARHTTHKHKHTKTNWEKWSTQKIQFFPFYF